jgi:hypothetical protein
MADDLASLEGWLSIWNAARISGLAIAALAAVVGLVASVAQHSVQTRVSKIKEVQSATRIARTQLQAARANERAAVLEKEAAQARLDLEKIKQPRRITAEQHAQLVNCLTPAPKGDVYVLPAKYDSDGPSFANQIEAALKDAGYVVRRQTERGGEPLFWHEAGNFLIVSPQYNPPELPPHASNIQECFAQIGFAMRVISNPDMPFGALGIGIGPRL